MTHWSPIHSVTVSALLSPCPPVSLERMTVWTELG